MTTTEIPRSVHLHYLQHCITLANKSPPKPTNFRVGSVLVSYSSSTPSSTPSLVTATTIRSHSDSESTSTPPDRQGLGTILATGYTLELPGNTHAEQCALSKLQSQAQAQSTSTSTTTFNPPDVDLNTLLPGTYDTVLYTSLEPCSIRLSGATPCVQRIIGTREPESANGVRKVVFGAKEPGTFVQDSQSCRILTDAGVEWEYLNDFETEILEVAKAGHVKQHQKSGGGTNVDDISQEERKRQEAQPRNPKKRMMEFVKDTSAGEAS